MAHSILERVKEVGDVTVSERSFFKTGRSSTSLWLNNNKGPDTLTYSALSLILQNLAEFLRNHDYSTVHFTVLYHAYGSQRVMIGTLFRNNNDITPNITLT